MKSIPQQFVSLVSYQVLGEKNERCQASSSGSDAWPRQTVAVSGDSRARAIQQCLSSAHLDGLPHVVESIGGLLVSPIEASVKAARTGQVQWLQNLLAQPNCRATNKAAIAAASCGQLDAVKMLISKRGKKAKRGLAFGVLCAAAGSDHVGVAEFAAELVAGKIWWECKALHRAISHGNVEIVKVLLDPKHKLHWCIGSAVDQAISEDQHALVRVVRELFPQYHPMTCYHENEKNDDLITSLARNGFTNVVKYLYANGLYSHSSLGEAFVAAVKKPEMIEFLFNTGTIPLASMEKAFVQATNAGAVDVMKFLYDKTQVPQQTLNEAFASSTSVELSTFLYDTGCITNDSVANVIQAKSYHAEDAIEIIKFLITEKKLPTELLTKAGMGAVGCEDYNLVKVLYDAKCFSPEAVNNIYRAAVRKCVGYGHRSRKIVDLLSESDALTVETIEETFMTASRYGSAKVIEGLVGNDRLTTEVITSGFVAAAKSGSAKVVRMLYNDHRASPMEITECFQDAARYGCFDVVQVLMNVSGIPQEAKNAAFIKAASDGGDAAKKLVARDTWPSSVVKQAIEAAKDDKMKKLLRTKLAV